MTTAVVTSDWHADAITLGLNRYDDVALAVDQVVQATLSLKADLFLFLGDLSDPDNVRSHRAVALATATAVRLDASGIPSLWLVGNHDVIEDGQGTHTLSALKELTSKRVTVLDQPRGGLVTGVNAWFIALPFVARTHSYDAAEFVRQQAEDYKVNERERPVVVLSHLTVPGIDVGSESDSMARGRDVLLPLDAIAEHFPRALVLQGHYHKRQSWTSPQGVVVHVPGSPERLRFDEEKHEPGFLIARW